MTRSTSSLGLSKPTRNRKASKSSVASSNSIRSISPRSVTSKYLNDLLRGFVDELCEIFVAARQCGKSEAQTVELILDHFTSQNQDAGQVFDWLLNNTHKQKYQTLLGYFYDQGIVTKRNQRKAYCYYLSAAKKDYLIAQDLLGDCYYSGQGTTKDRYMAFEWYHKAADNGSTGSQFSLGICYAYGEGTPKDHYKALQCYKKSATGGNVSGMNELGYCYEVGIGTKPDNRKAFLLFEQAAKGENPPGQHNLASCYEEGKGTDEDIDKAIYWYQKSADNGHEVAQQRVQGLLNLQKNDVDLLTNRIG